MADPRTNRSLARVGQTLSGKWKVDSFIGAGGMAAVYAATHRNGMRVAVKVLHPDLAADPETKARFSREGYLANKVDHKGCVAVIDDATTEDGSPLLVMELLNGETLQHRAERLGNRLPVAEVVAFADQLLDVLAAAHEKGIVHRDIKPENLFVTTDGALKVFDFGLARIRESSINPTVSGSVMGTPAFMSPEQAMGKSSKLDGRADLWSVGATMFTMLTGNLIHTAPTVTELLLLLVTQPVAPIATVMPSISPALARVIDRALSFNMEERWPDARSMQAALRAAAASQVGQDVLAAPPAAPEPVPPPARSRPDQAWNGVPAPPMSQPMSQQMPPQMLPPMSQQMPPLRPDLSWGPAATPQAAPGAPGMMPLMPPQQPWAPTNRTIPMHGPELARAVAMAETMIASAQPKPAAQQRSLVLPLVVGVMVVVIGVTAILLFGGIVGGHRDAPPPAPVPAGSR